MPVEEALLIQRGIQVAGAVQRKYGETFAPGIGTAAVGQTQASGEGRSQGADVEPFARGDDVLQQGVEGSLCLGIPTYHASHSQQLSLQERALTQQGRESIGLPDEVRPVRLLPDPPLVLHGSPQVMSRIELLFGSLHEPIVRSIRLIVQRGSGLSRTGYHPSA